MNLTSFRRPARLACVLLFGISVAFGAVGCVDTYATAPVYRGSYYAYDAYPYGYRGYPAYPYYGAPFGNSASLVVTERSGYGERRRYDGYRRNHRHDGYYRARSERTRRGSDYRTQPTEQQR